MNVVQKFFTDIIELSESEKASSQMVEQQVGARRQAFCEIAAKVQAMPFNDATIDSFLVWLKEQE
jgi:hypothetical protein